MWWVRAVESTAAETGSAHHTGLRSRSPRSNITRQTSSNAAINALRANTSVTRTLRQNGREVPSASAATKPAQGGPGAIVTAEARAAHPGAGRTEGRGGRMG